MQRVLSRTREILKRNNRHMQFLLDSWGELARGACQFERGKKEIQKREVWQEKGPGDETDLLESEKKKPEEPRRKRNRGGNSEKGQVTGRTSNRGGEQGRRGIESNGRRGQVRTIKKGRRAENARRINT